MTLYKKEFNAKLGFKGSKNTLITTVEEFLDQEPFNPQIRKWFREHTEVRDALKIIITSRFVATHAISTVDNPLLKGVKQSIGIYSVDKTMACMIKQDYLMHEEDDTFVLFTGIPKEGNVKISKYVQNVKTLESRYGPDGRNFYNNHHPKFEEIASQIRPYIDIALKNCKESIRKV